MRNPIPSKWGDYKAMEKAKGNLMRWTEKWVRAK
jgi:hypothetical protein